MAIFFKTSKQKEIALTSFKGQEIDRLHEKYQREIKTLKHGNDARSKRQNNRHQADLKQLKQEHDEGLKYLGEGYEEEVQQQRLNHEAEHRAQKRELEALYTSQRDTNNTLHQLRKDHQIAMRLLKDHHNIDDLAQIKDVESCVRAHQDELRAVNSGMCGRDGSTSSQAKENR